MSVSEVRIVRAQNKVALIAPLSLLGAAAFVLFSTWTGYAGAGPVLLACLLLLATGWYAAYAIALAIYRSKDRTVLKFDRDGFNEIGVLRQRRVNWSDCSEFSIWTMGGSRMIVFENQSLSWSFYRLLSRWLCKRNDWIGVPLPEPLEPLVESLNTLRQDCSSGASQS